MTELVDGPEWGWCKVAGCEEPAEPLWLSGGFPDDPSLLLCYTHTGERIGSALTLARAALTETIARLASYDWNADPDGITKMQGDAFAAMTEVF